MSVGITKQRHHPQRHAGWCIGEDMGENNYSISRSSRLSCCCVGYYKGDSRIPPHPTTGAEAMTQQNTYRCCEVCPNVPCKPLFRVNCIRQDPATIRNATLDEIVSYHKDMIARLHKPKNGAVSIVSIRSAVIQHEKSIAKLESLRAKEPHP